MWYQSKHTQIMNPQEWYDIVAEQYINFHKHLDSFENGTFTRFLPREENINIIDLGAGDGRLFKYFQKTNFKSYTACDISPKLLEQHPGDINKVVCDLEDKLPFDTDSFDLALSFFVLEHIDDLNNYFEEAYRILKNWWKLIIGHFFQRREFERDIGKWKDKNKMKIKQYKYKLDDIIDAAQYNFFKTHTTPIHEDKILLWHIIVCEK